MTETRDFHIGDVLSAATGYLVSPDHIGGVYNILGWMVGEELMTHQLPRVSNEMEPILREQFPELTSEPIPEMNSWPEVDAFLHTLYPKYGERVTVRKPEPIDHTPINPIAEIRMINPSATIISPDEETR